MRESSKPWGNAAEIGAGHSSSLTQFNFKIIFQKGPIDNLNMIAFWKFYSSSHNRLRFSSSLHLVPVITVIISSSQRNETSHRLSSKSCY